MNTLKNIWCNLKWHCCKTDVYFSLNVSERLIRLCEVSTSLWGDCYTPIQNRWQDVHLITKCNHKLCVNERLSKNETSYFNNRVAGDVYNIAQDWTTRLYTVLCSPVCFLSGLWVFFPWLGLTSKTLQTLLWLHGCNSLSATLMSVIRHI